MTGRTSRSPHSTPPHSTIVLLVAMLAFAGIISWRALSSSSKAEVVVTTLALGASPSTDSLAALIVQGRRTYEGKAGGALCATCHGPAAKGVAGIGPDLTDGTWLHGDGSMEFIRAIIRSGVTNPKKTAAVMPPYGGSPLKPDQLEAVAAYVHSLSTASR